MAFISNGSNEQDEHEERISGKHILQFWSGGADSTYLLLQNLMCGHLVTVAYVDIENNKTKSKREIAAQSLLEKDIDKFTAYFHCQEPRLLPYNRVRFLSEPFSHCVAPQQVIFAMFSLLIGSGYSEIQMGVVQGDSMCGSRFNEAIAEVYKEHFYTERFPLITYPIEQVSKEAEYLTLKGYDELLGTHFVQHITVCESIAKPCGKAKKCLPCQTQQEVFKRLKWVE